VVINWVATGTHNGGLRTPTGDTLPPTGKKASVPGSTTYQFKGAKVARSWVYWDMVTLLAQLGLMPGM
jgi:predicted ester cyclase